MLRNLYNFLLLITLYYQIIFQIFILFFLFFKQSVLREMILQEVKTQINSLPKLEKHNNADYCFEMVLEEPRKSHWLYSEPLNKIYIRMGKTFNIDVKFRLKMPIQPLNLRAFLCFVKDVSGPVLRCQNHLSEESE